MLDELRAEVLEMNLELPRHRLVVWTGGNVSGRDLDSGYVVIKPSGVPFSQLTLESMVVVGPDESVKQGHLKPSVDLGIHLQLYAARPDVCGITHSHSPYATSFSFHTDGIPAALTPLTHLIGSGVPCTRYATPGAIDTAAAIMESVGETGNAAIVARHGVFTMASSARKSLEIALHVEEAAKTIRLAQQAGPVTSLDDTEIARCAAWYRTNYGQQTNYEQQS
ncbi:MAG: class II aldolase/adducin family protein [bacterium]|nr:class II aldolase/adducin family protein [bacterium]